MPSTYEPIATTTLGSAQASYTFSSIPSTYTDLVIIVSGTMSAAGAVCQMQFNGDTANNYSMTELYGNGTSAGSYRRSSQSWLEITYNIVNFSNTDISNTIINVLNYSNTSTYKTAISRQNTAVATYGGVAASVGLWRSTAAINSIKVGSNFNFNTGTTLTLYGIKAA